jgi:sialic acid synthase SpsE
LPAGTVLREHHLALKKPGNGIPATQWHEVVSRKLKRGVLADTVLREDDLEPAVNSHF